MVELRGEYCKNGTAKPQERTHMMVVVILLHITALSQYGLCFLYWAYTSKTRPSWPEILFIVLGIVAPVLGSLYTMFSPLGWKTESRSDEESQQTVAIGDDTEENELKSCKKRVVVSFPEWVGGLFDLWDDLTVFFLSFFCTFCVFGWNMERLGFGNMYVHIITFILLCCAPVLVFSVTALNINDIVTKYVVEITGILLCLCGFLYGGFWRIQIRRRFKLPANTFCCGYSAFTDFMQWLFCWSCSLAQEVRTGNFYDIEDDSFHRKESEVELLEVLASLPQENGAEPVVVMSSLELATGTRSASEDHSDLENLKSRQGDIYEAERDDMTKPPPHPFIQREEK
ncbi:hypothetical protein HPP92_007401 [Vanilla planifolia]|uniref:Uncharacterized protein n=1 Tax=Vanilla planifolia TaxID=51239 RepID=A0A835VAM1_VANPL|nr:hypothetical protein HPP92_007401 [Vanilla planifolia]